MRKYGKYNPNPARGSSAGMSKLTEKQVRVIRRAVRMGIPQVRLARRFKVSPPAIYQIVSRMTWRHIP